MTTWRSRAELVRERRAQQLLYECTADTPPLRCCVRVPSVELLLRLGDKPVARAITRRFTTVSAADTASDGTPLSRRCASYEANSMPSATLGAPSLQAPLILEPASAVAAFTLELALVSLRSLGPQPSASAVESHARLQLLHSDALLRVNKQHEALQLASEVCASPLLESDGGSTDAFHTHLLLCSGACRPVMLLLVLIQVASALPGSPDAWNVVGRAYRELRPATVPPV